MSLKLVAHHWFFLAGNNRSQFHGFYAPLKRLRVPFVFKVQNTINKNEAVLEPGLAFKENLSPKSFQRTPEMKNSIRNTKTKNEMKLVKNAIR